MSRLNIVTALRCEAEPLIQAFDLGRAVADSGVNPGRKNAFRVYTGPQVSLVVSGVGKLASAAATAYLGGLAGGEETIAWLNVGCAGTAERALGAAILAESIVDRETGKAWYPALLLESKLKTAPVTTISHVERDYSGDSFYEMEASGFFTAAGRFSTLELIQVVKVVSDNRDSSVDRVDAALISRLIEARVPEIRDVVDQLLRMADGLQAEPCEPERIEAFVGSWRFTFSQRAMLKRYLERASALAMDAEFQPAAFEDCASSRDVLAKMDRLLSEAPVRMG